MEHGNTQAIKINKTWYELDLFCGDDRILNHTQSLRISTLSISDHRAKQTLASHVRAIRSSQSSSDSRYFKMLRFPIDPAIEAIYLGIFHDFPTKTSMFDTKTYIFRSLAATRCGHHHCLRCHQRHRPRQGGWMAG